MRVKIVVVIALFLVNCERLANNLPAHISISAVELRGRVIESLKKQIQTNRLIELARALFCWLAREFCCCIIMIIYVCHMSELAGFVCVLPS